MPKKKDENEKRSFLDPLKRVLDEEKRRTRPADKEKEKSTNSSDNLVEAEPDVKDFFRPKQ